MIGFYELIRKIRKRPALYLGKPSIDHLQVFLDGYTFARRELGVPLSQEEEYFEKFQEWIESKYNLPDTQSWMKIILFYSADERDALERFFDLFEEFIGENVDLAKYAGKIKLSTDPLKYQQQIRNE
ncbi:hypothetical protein [Okeania sp. SIO2B3]|uniref:hypothetical protein n=1 Tax=Okeania sp. SIO2B3 TaxID=2607784 RepID=UPI0025DFF05F|nr:hypothetical protein [Okeania sp. SIO2B3]